MERAKEQFGNILLEGGLPEELEGMRIYPDFRNMIRFSLLLQDESLNDAAKMYGGIQQLFGEIPACGEAHAAELLAWFYRGGSPDSGEKPAERGGRQPEQAYDFDEDDKHLFAAFRQAYGINLADVDYMHWWIFLALLDDLPAETAMARVMQWRTMELSQIKDKATRAHYAELKKRFALTSPAARGRSLEEISRRNQERVAQRFAEVKRRKEEQEQG